MVQRILNFFLFFFFLGGGVTLNSVIINLHSSSIWKLSLVEHVPSNNLDVMLASQSRHLKTSCTSWFRENVVLFKWATRLFDTEQYNQRSLPHRCGFHIIYIFTGNNPCTYRTWCQSRYGPKRNCVFVENKAMHKSQLLKFTILTPSNPQIPFYLAYALKLYCEPCRLLLSRYSSAARVWNRMWHFPTGLNNATVASRRVRLVL